MKNNYLLAGSIIIAGLMIGSAWLYAPHPSGSRSSAADPDQGEIALSPEETVAPSEGVELPVRWGDLGAKLVSVGVIDWKKFDALYSDMGKEERRLLEGLDNGNITITERNARFLLNLFWALGLGTKNRILETGPMMDPRYGGAGNFASTGGWTIAEGHPMNHYSRHPFVVLDSDQQELVERVSPNIYRPCCNNGTHFPDCNHGMAMLGLLELMASQGSSEEEMYKAALSVNAYWFPEQYLTIAQYLAQNGTDWKIADPKVILGADYSSGAGYQKVVAAMTAPVDRGSGSCGV